MRTFNGEYPFSLLASLINEVRELFCTVGGDFCCAISHNANSVAQSFRMLKIEFGPIIALVLLLLVLLLILLNNIGPFSTSPFKKNNKYQRNLYYYFLKKNYKPLVIGLLIKCTPFALMKLAKLYNKLLKFLLFSITYPE